MIITIRFENGNEFTDCGVKGYTKLMRGANRECIEIKLTGTNYNLIKSAFVDGAKYSLIVPETAPTNNVDESGNTVCTVNYTEYDKSNYCISGDVIDHRDNTYSIFMGEKTAFEIETEALQTAVDELMLEVLA